jgi:hypothetical protein
MYVGEGELAVGQVSLTAKAASELGIQMKRVCWASSADSKLAHWASRDERRQGGAEPVHECFTTVLVILDSLCGAL